MVSTWDVATYEWWRCLEQVVTVVWLLLNRRNPSWSKGLTPPLASLAWRMRISVKKANAALWQKKVTCKTAFYNSHPYSLFACLYILCLYAFCFHCWLKTKTKKRQQPSSEKQASRGKAVYHCKVLRMYVCLGKWVNFKTSLCHRKKAIIEQLFRV